MTKLDTYIKGQKWNSQFESSIVKIPCS